MSYSRAQRGRIWTIVFGVIVPLRLFGLGSVPYVTERPTVGGLQMVYHKKAATIWVDEEDFAGVRRSATNLQADIGRVTRCLPKLTTDVKDLGLDAIIVGTIGKSRVIQELVRAGKLNVSEV